MKKIISLIFALTFVINVHSQTCPTCGGAAQTGGGHGDEVGPDLQVSMGAMSYGQSAGSVTLNSSVPDPILSTPAALQFSSGSLTNVIVVTTNILSVDPIFDTNTTCVATLVTNIFYSTNEIADGNTVVDVLVTNALLDQVLVNVTNIVVTQVTNTVILQVQAPQAIADIPPPPTTGGYVINFYYPSQATGQSGGLDQFTGQTPFITWLITNSSPQGVNQLQVSEYENGTNYGLIKQRTYTYSTNTGAWTVGDLEGIQETELINNLSATNYQVIDTFQYSNSPVAYQVANTYETMDWSDCTNEVLVTNTVGTGASAETTVYTYWDPAAFGAGSVTLVRSITHPDGSWEYYNEYDPNGNPTDVYSSYEDVPLSDAFNGNNNARETAYTYDPVAAGVSYSGDNGTADPNVPRLTIRYINGNKVSQSYTVFPSVSERLDIQCTNIGAAWNAPGNLITTNYFYSSGPNQFLSQSTLRPDGTMTAYYYATNATCQTNIVVTGEPDPTGTNIVDGVSNVVVVNIFGQNVSSISYDVVSHLILSQDLYSDFDSFDRPQQVTHLDGTTEYMTYACCGLEDTVDKDGVATVYLYDSDKRQYGYQKIYSGGNIITWQNNLDAVGHVAQAFRVGTDGHSVTMSQSAYDLAGELIAQTNALGGVTTHTHANDPTTGALIRSTVDPDGGVITNLYYVDGSLKETLGTGVHGEAYAYGYATDVNGNICTYTIVTNLNGNNLTAEWTETFSDMAGRTTEILYANGSNSQSFYNPQGQLSKQIDPDGVATLYQYDAKGNLAYTAVDMEGSGTIDFSSSGSDRITQTTNDVTTDHGVTVNRSRTYAWLDGQSTGTLISMTENSANGLNTWQTQYRDISTPVTSESQTAYSSPSRTVTNTAPDGSYTVNNYSYGRLVSSTRYDSGNNQIGATTYGYDPQGRQNTMTDARNGTTTLVYNNVDLVATNTTPNPGNGSPESTVTTYNNMLQAIGVTQPDGTVVNSSYLLTGELGLQYGSRTYPVGYSYDYAGRMQTMTNWSNYAGNSGRRVTTWSYDPYRGFLTSKTYDGGTAGPSYAYTGAGRLASRTWARGITTRYSYGAGGDLTNAAYGDNVTPTVGYAYDRLGRQNSITWTNITDTLTYNLANELQIESFSGGILTGLSVTNGYDQYLRRTNLVALGSSFPIQAIYGYDHVSRLQTVTDGNNNWATYSYVANSPLVGQIMYQQSGTTRMTTSKQWDYLNRLTQISSAPSAAYTSPLTYNYNYNPANQRTKDTLADGSYWIYGYDSLGQVTNGCKYFASGTPVVGQQFDYTFDTIGNRTQTQSGGDTNGANLRVANYYANNLNQLTNRDIPGYVDVMGASILSNSVTVNGQTAYRNQEYFRQQLPANNSASALWTNIIVAGGQNVTGNVYVAKEPEVFKYDPDGNLTNDGRWAYTWDGENRLTKMTVNTNVGPQYTLTFAYDPKGRRIQKMVVSNSVAIYTNNFLYDGWNLVSILNSPSSILESFLWGNDLSGSQQGAGGVGGLLEVSYHGSTTTNCFPAYDGNGNVMALVNAADGTQLANYDYGPFGEVIRMTGPMAKVTRFRFSTKYDDDESDLLYYGYRYYKPSTGTWPNRDPLNAATGAEARFDLLQDDGFDDDIAQSIAASPVDLNDYIFAHNQPVVDYDLFGLCVSLPDSGSGSVNGSDPIHIGLHKWGKHHHLPPGWGGAATITFKVCCPATVQYLKTWGETALQTVVGTPPPTLNGNTFPYSVQSGPSGSGPCYTIVLEVPSTTATEYWTGTSSYANFLSTIRIVGQCCCSSSGSPTQNNPPPLPPLPPPPRHGSGL